MAIRALCRLSASSAFRAAHFPSQAFATRAERAARMVSVADPKAIANLFDRLQSGASTLIGVTVERTDTSLKLVGPDSKSFLISVERLDPPSLRLQSTAATGLAKGEHYYDYQFNPVNGQWTCVTDKHYLIELLTRDCVYHFQGVPSW